MNSLGEFIDVPKNTIEPRAKDGGVTDRNTDEDAMASPRSFVFENNTIAETSPTKLGHKQSSPSI